jgi:hypothetical protein
MPGPMLINGQQYSWASLIFTIADWRDEAAGAESVDYGHKRTREKKTGSNRDQAPRVRTSGVYEVDPLKVTIRKDHADALRARLASLSPDGRSYGNVQFEALLQFSEPGADVSTVELRELVWSGTSCGLKQGPEGLMESLEMDPMRIIENGLTLYDSSEADAPL